MLCHCLVFKSQLVSVVENINHNEVIRSILTA